MNSTGSIILLTLLGLVLAVVLGVFVVMFVIVPVFKGIGWVLRQIGLFIAGEVTDALRLLGAIVLTLVYIPLVLASVLIGRWSASAHYSGAMKSEIKVAGLCIYRMLVGHPLKLVGAGAVVQGLEERLPEVVAAAPTSDGPSKRTGIFDGYTIVGSMAGGGSGGKLYIAEPDAVKAASLERSGYLNVDQVVIKSFSLKDGSTLPQIVRESRALDAAKKLGLVLDHDLTGERFYYVMRYVPGKPLTFVAQQLHAESSPASVGAAGLDDKHLAVALGYAADLLATLSTYHRGGLWHKDVKPDNIIVDGTPGKEHAHLVDFGLVTPLRSAMTLTTHGTEYFRDPEMVRLALRGVKVQDVDGTKFDIFAAGAVLYAIVENSFPAHGALSQISKRCPEAIRWIIRRAMTDYDKRYPTAAAMLADLDVVRRAPDAFKVRPVDLPSMRELSESDVAEPAPQPEMPPLPRSMQNARGIGQGAAYMAAASTIPPAIGNVAAAGANGAGAAAAAAAGVFGGGSNAAGSSGKPAISIRNWWTGQFEVAQPARREQPRSTSAASAPMPSTPYGEDVFQAAGAANRAGARVGPRASAAEQLERARKRVDQARERAHARLSGRRHRRDYSNAPRITIPLIVACVMLPIVWKYTPWSRGKPTDLLSRNDTSITAPAFSLSADGLVATLDTPTPPGVPSLPGAPGTVTASFADGASPITSANPATAPAAITDWIRTLPPEAQAEAQQKVMQTQAQLQAIVEKARRELFEIQDRVERTLPRNAMDSSEPDMVIATEPPVIDDATLRRDALVARLAGKPVVMVNELRAPLAADVATTLRTYGKRLERLGVSIIGEAPWRAADPDEIELVATLRNACGTTPTDTPEFGEQVRTWLEERDPDSEAWAILWVVATPDGKARVHLIGPLDEHGNPDAELRTQVLQRLASDAPAAPTRKAKSAKSSKSSL